MFDTFTYRFLHFRRPTLTPSSLPSLPQGIERFFVDTPGGQIEVLHGKPSKQARHGATPLFFVHGGMGGAWVWLEYLSFFASRGIPCYAVSMRGHGSSWHPSYLRMVYFTTKRMLADDVVAAIKWVQKRHDGREVVYIGHSSGGGLGQYILSAPEFDHVKVKGLVLAGAVPGFGSLGVYINWWRLDPWFSFRMIFHGWHPNSPLSHPVLTRRVFFGEQLPGSYLMKFQQRASRYESFLWPLGMMSRFVKPENLLPRITSWRANKGQGIMVLGGEIDKIMTIPVMEKLANTYRESYTGLVAQKKIEGDDRDGVKKLLGDGGRDTVGQGVRCCYVPGAGHHLQNDVTWEIGAQKLLAFYEQL
ncbi:uncharacterized protein PODANS_6_4030 [Podospora anserina S mat+]|uniref:Abhydrolase domain-containing protein n=1 Tax=Podospora anserina (strain S / ATCC MYA-4624 / DSM 980 / FGSC 10383) TaxID=515849 RepID=B2B1P7_PODAN|nr:uncharacterized protein PODANS_6_4030 [Podospora anserina S mat+]CAP71032.1 unnamed protein product [Podospora anserina S mat+]CDP30432.1 Putative Abhydrolase domain-containing protein [Podospora anserina S mat+]